jgi:hypothetical protein
MKGAAANTMTRGTTMKRRLRLSATSVRIAGGRATQEPRERVAASETSIRPRSTISRGFFPIDLGVARRLTTRQSMSTR